MIRSCFVQSTSKPISQMPVTWSRLFHIRKSLCLAFKPGSGQQENEAGEKGERKDRMFKEKARFYNERESQRFQKPENFRRNNQEYPTIPDYSGEFKYFDGEQTKFPNERQERTFDRKEMRYNSARESEHAREGDRGFKRNNYRYSYSHIRNRSRSFDRDQRTNYDHIEGQQFDRHEMSYNRPVAREWAEQGRERYRGFKQNENSSSDRDNYRYTRRQNQDYDRQQTNIYDERDEPDFDRREMRYSKSFRDSEHGSKEGREFRHYNEHRYTDRENSGRNFDRGQTSFYDKRGEQSFDKHERTYSRDVQSGRRKDLPYFGEKSDRPDRNTFVPDFADAEPDTEANTMEDTEVKKHLKGKLPKDWTENFGTLSSLSETDPTLQSVLFEDENQISRTSASVTDTVYDEGVEINEEEKPHIRLSKTNRRHIPAWYSRKIQKLGKKGLVREAIEVFDKWMIEEDRVKPSHYEFGQLIKLLGRAGYTQKAFSLYAQMVKMDLVPEGQIFTSLFNACAKSPLKKDALERAHKLRMNMIIQGYEPHEKTYGAMVNAFGMCGDTEMALSLVDEALQKHRSSQNFLNCSLATCVSDREAGFRHAIQIWRKFIKLGVRPDIRSYNLLLRAVNECGVGPLTQENTLLLIEAESQLQNEDANKKSKQTKVVSSLQYTVDPNMYSSGSVVEVVEGVSADSNISSNPVRHPIVNNADFEVENGEQIVDVSDWLEHGLIERSAVQSSDVDAPYAMPETMPDILNPFDRSLQVVYLGWIKSRKHRLALLGGMKGVLSNIEKYRATPNIVTFSELLLATSEIEEKEIWDLMALYDVQPDTDFFNHLIVKMERRRDCQSALKVPALMRQRNLVPNLSTYGCLAKVCLLQQDAHALFESMEKANMIPNYVIMHTLMKKSSGNFWYKEFVLRTFELLDLEPTTEMIEKIEHHISLAKKDLVNLEQGKEVEVDYHKMKRFPEGFKSFMKYYESWLERTSIQKKEPVWREYRENIEEPIVDSAEVIEDKKHEPKKNKPETKERKQGHKKGESGPSTVAKTKTLKKSAARSAALDFRKNKQDIQRGLQRNQISIENIE